MSYNSFSGVDISGVFKSKVLKDLQSIEYKIIRVRCFGWSLKTGKLVHAPNCECFPRVISPIEFLYCENQIPEAKRQADE